VRPAVVAVSLAMVAAACGAGGDHKSTAGTTAKTAATTTTTAAVPGSASAPGASTTPVSAVVTHPAAHLVAVRVARQDGFDRVVFEFREQTPGYRIAYATGPVHNTAGQEVTVAGGTKLVVHLEQATGADSYTGPARVTAPGTSQVLELARIEDFEAVLSWVVGVRTEAPIRVTTLTSPPRVVIDVVG